SDSRLVKEMKKRGWRWGGDWTSLKDYHHFDKP
ncbi:MAG: M15 family metallopeptidase, partial [Candidatus Kapaibacterium sp.]